MGGDGKRRSLFQKNNLKRNVQKYKGRGKLAISQKYCHFWSIICVKECEESREGGGNWILKVIIHHAKDFRALYCIME